MNLKIGVAFLACISLALFFSAAHGQDNGEAGVQTVNPVIVVIPMSQPDTARHAVYDIYDHTVSIIDIDKNGLSRVRSVTAYLAPEKKGPPHP